MSATTMSTVEIISIRVNNRFYSYHEFVCDFLRCPIVPYSIDIESINRIISTINEFSKSIFHVSIDVANGIKEISMDIPRKKKAVRIKTSQLIYDDSDYIIISINNGKYVSCHHIDIGCNTTIEDVSY